MVLCEPALTQCLGAMLSTLQPNWYAIDVLNYIHFYIYTYADVVKIYKCTEDPLKMAHYMWSPYFSCHGHDILPLTPLDNRHKNTRIRYTCFETLNYLSKQKTKLIPEDLERGRVTWIILCLHLKPASP